MNSTNNKKSLFFYALIVFTTTIITPSYRIFPIKSFSKNLYTFITSKICSLGSIKKNTQSPTMKCFVTNYFENSSIPSCYKIYTTDKFGNLIRTEIEIKEPLRNQKLITAFSYLTKASFSSVPLMKTHKYDTTIGYVDFLDGSISIDEKLNEELPPSQIVRVLLHEFRHMQQFKQLDKDEIQELIQQRKNNPYNRIIIPPFQKFYHPQVLTQSAKKNTPSNPLFNPLWDHQEYDADHFAAGKISCPICLKIIQAKTTPLDFFDCKIGDNKHLFGYFGFEDYQPFIEAIKEHKRCPAHTKRSNTDDEHNEIITELESALDQIEKDLNDPKFQENFNNLKKSIQDADKDEYIDAQIKSLKTVLSNKETKYKKFYDKVCDLDNRSGSLLLHLPNFGKDVINSLQSDQNLWLTILENEKKRKELKLLPEACNSALK